MKAARSSMLGAGMSNSSFKYSRLAADEDGYIDLQVRPCFLCIFSFKPPFLEYYVVPGFSRLKLSLVLFVWILQFKKSPPKVPYKAIALAIFLFLIGSLLIILGALLLSGVIEVEVSLVTVVKAICRRASFSLCLDSLILDYAVHMLFLWPAYCQWCHIFPPCGFKTANNLTDLFP